MRICQDISRVCVVLGLAVACTEGSMAGGEESVDPIPIRIPLKADSRAVIEAKMRKHDITLMEFVQHFGIIVYEGSELEFAEREPVIEGKLAHSQAVLLVHLVSILAQKDKAEQESYIEAVFGGGCEFCRLEDLRYDSVFSRIPSTS